ncbi:MAG: hypothetical protein DHS20C15_16690 [Planctomycetota bacterium]|nr:MAG: hypothetical protein DHS20C15_16690 [Planctomycetota bacterium]
MAERATTRASARAALVIPTLNGGERFARCLEMWRAQEGVGELEICCPDSGSRDGTVDVIRKHNGRVLPIPSREFNHGDTRNRAVAVVRADYVFLSVQDAVPLDTRMAAELLAPLEADPGLAATFGRQVPLPDCHPVLEARIAGWAGGSEPVVQELGARRWDDLEPMERLGLIRYDHVIACMRRSVWERLRFEALSFGEDIGWAVRVIRPGGRIAFVPSAAVEHSHDRPAFEEARRIYCDHRNLKALVGLTTVPSHQQLKANVQAARQHYRALIDARDDVDEATRARWHEWAHALAGYENWAQYLGANFARRWWFTPVDRWLRRGI